jgi:DNA-directed RNA polymerase specialized sigma24 family protein
VDDQSTAVLQGQLEQAVPGDAQARQRLLELTRDRLMRHARRLLHGGYARLEPFAQTDDVVQQLYVKILQNQDRFWLDANGEPVRSLAEFFGHTSAWMRDVLCDLLRKAYGRDDNRPGMLPLDGGPSDTGPLHEPSCSTFDGEKLRRWTESTKRWPGCLTTCGRSLTCCGIRSCHRPRLPPCWVSPCER